MKNQNLNHLPLSHQTLPFSAIMKVLHALIIKILTCGLVPSSWREALMVPIFKKKGDPMDPSNYCPISLTSSLRKTLEIVLMPHVLEYLEPLAVEQGGFRPQRSTLDQVYALQHIMTRGDPVHVCLMDV